MRIVIIGSGNVASVLAPALSASARIVAVASATQEHAVELASRFPECEALTDVSVLPEADVYLIAVSDDAIADVVSRAKPVPDAVWLHTSGSIDSSVLAPLSSHYGVFYPLQTFTKGVRLDLSHVPFFIEGSDQFTCETARRLARSVSDAVYYADSRLRMRMHVAAVFACNFTNYLWGVADDILRRESLSVKVLEPLLVETLRKAMAVTPGSAQTGPARRGDIRVMQSHISLLRESGHESEADLYEDISRRILNLYHPDDQL